MKHTAFWWGVAAGLLWSRYTPALEPADTDILWATVGVGVCCAVIWCVARRLWKGYW
jgi:hypothetical protein